MVDHLLLCLAMGMALGLAAHLALGAPWPIAAAIAVIAATGLPHLALEHLIRRRKRLFLGQFPDAIDLIVRGVRSGLPVAEALQAGADAVLLDNMNDEQVGEAVRRVGGRVPVEVSGNVDLARVPRLAALGVDVVSVGALTHSARAADISLLFDIGR